MRNLNPLSFITNSSVFGAYIKNTQTVIFNRSGEELESEDSFFMTAKELEMVQKMNTVVDTKPSILERVTVFSPLTQISYVSENKSVILFVQTPYMRKAKIVQAMLVIAEGEMPESLIRTYGQLKAEVYQAVQEQTQERCLAMA